MKVNIDSELRENRGKKAIKIRMSRKVCMDVYKYKYVNCEHTRVNYDHNASCWGLGTTVTSLNEDLRFFQIDDRLNTEKPRDLSNM